MSTPETGALVADVPDLIRRARTELRLAVEAEALDRMDDLIRRISAARNRATGFERADLGELLDRALDTRRRHFDK